MISVVEFVQACERHHLLAATQFEELRSRLRSFLDAKSLARDLLDRGWLTPFQANQLLTGRGQELQLGSYVLIERIGEGGMGTVFKAQNWKLERLCAVKVIRKERLASNDAVKRFAREIEAAGQLDHPNIVRAEDAGESGGIHFFVMEYVAGVSLSKLVKDHGPVPVSLACEYIRQAALGLQHAHERKQVHRDIKPGNLLLSRSKGAGAVKVLDMGLARINLDGNEDATTLTETGAIVGTPDYMSPEQSRSASTVDGRSDLYSLGCTFYYLLIGRPPFAGGSTAEKIVKHQLERPQPIEELRPDVPSAVTEVVYRLLAKKPEERFQSAAELAEHLQGLLARASLWTSTRASSTAITDSPSATAPLHATPFWTNIVSEATVEAPRRSQLAFPVSIVAFASVVVCLVLLGLTLISMGVFNRAPAAEKVIALEGELHRDDPLDPYRQAALKVNSPHRVHEVSLEAGKCYTIELQSEYFDTYLRIENLKGACLAVDDDGGENRSSRIAFVATASAPYKLIVTTSQGIGPYRLKLTPAPPSFVANGTLNAAKQPHRVKLNPGTRYAIDLMSSSFDAFLRVEDDKGVLVDETDAGGVGKNARLFVEPAQVGDYNIVATSKNGTGRGAFTLTVVAAGKAPVPQPLVNGFAKGQLLPSDLPDKVRGTQPCKIFTYPMKVGQSYVIDLEAISFDPYLRLESPNGAPIAADDDSGEGSSSQISYTPQRDGLYRLIATSYATIGTGHFTLRVTGLNTKLLLDFTGYLGKKGIAIRKVNLTAGRKYLLDVVSTDFDSVANLKDSAGTSVARDDDSGGNLNPRIAYSCTQTGEYTLEITQYTDTGAGNYRCTMREITEVRK